MSQEYPLNMSGATQVDFERMRDLLRENSELKQQRDALLEALEEAYEAKMFDQKLLDKCADAIAKAKGES